MHRTKPGRPARITKKAKKAAATEPAKAPKGRPPVTKGQRLPPSVLTPAEVESLIEVARGRGGPSGLRNAALIVLAYRSGLRVTECLSLASHDVDLVKGVITVRHGKGDKSRTVGLDVWGCSLVREWSARRAELGISNAAPFFCSITDGDVWTPRGVVKTSPGQPLKTHAIRALMIRLRKKAKIEKRANFHALRHSCAFGMLEEGINIGIISRTLGHADLATTSHYLNHIAPMDVIDAMRAREWQSTTPKPAK